MSDTWVSGRGPASAAFIFVFIFHFVDLFYLFIPSHCYLLPFNFANLLVCVLVGGWKKWTTPCAWSDRPKVKVALNVMHEKAMETFYNMLCGN